MYGISLYKYNVQINPQTNIYLQVDRMDFHIGVEQSWQYYSGILLLTRNRVQVARRPNNLAPGRHRGRFIPRHKTIVMNVL